MIRPLIRILIHLGLDQVFLNFFKRDFLTVWVLALVVV